MALSSNEKQEAYENGQYAYNRGKDDLLGPSRHEPWRDLFESAEDYDERLEAHNNGFDNARDSDRR